MYVLIVTLGAVAVVTQVNRKSSAVPMSEVKKDPVVVKIEESLPRHCLGSQTSCEAILKNGQKTKISVLKDTTKGTMWVLVGNRPVRLQEFYDTVYRGARPDSVMEVDFKKDQQ